MSDDAHNSGKKVDSYSEKDYENEANEQTGPVGWHGEELKRQLKSRHVAMISIGGVIGTGLFLVSILSSPRWPAYLSVSPLTTPGKITVRTINAADHDSTIRVRLHPSKSVVPLVFCWVTS